MSAPAEPLASETTTKLAAAAIALVTAALPKRESEVEGEDALAAKKQRHVHAARVELDEVPSSLQDGVTPGFSDEQLASLA